MKPTDPSATTIVCSNLSTNCLGRALVLADVAARLGPTKIVGFNVGGALWAPALSSEVTIHSYPLSSSWGYRAAALWLRSQMRGTKVIVSKPVYSSLGLVLRAGVSKESLLLDNDDWEMGLRATHGPQGFARIFEILNPKKLNGNFSTRYLDRRLKAFPHQLVSNAWLQRRYGGEVLPHVRDTALLDPKLSNIPELRKKLKLGDRFWVGFIGTPRSHKGLDELIEILASFEGKNAPGLYVAGVDFEDKYAAAVHLQALQSLGEKRVRFLPSFPFSELRDHVAPVDCICLPSRDNERARGQLPAKLIDAMSMGKPVVASGHNDIGPLLEGCGVAVPPGNTQAMREGIDLLVHDKELRERYGRRAREKAVSELSVESGMFTLERVLNEVVLCD